MSAVRSFVGATFKVHEYVTKEIIQEITLCIIMDSNGIKTRDQNHIKLIINL